MQAENGNAAAVSRQSDCNWERLEEKAARKKLPAVVAHHSPRRKKKMPAGAAYSSWAPNIYSKQLSRAAPAHARETSSGMIARHFADGGFPVGLHVGHAQIDALENLFFRQPGIFQAPDLRASYRPLPRQPPVQNLIHGSVGKSDQTQHHRVPADNVELIAFRNLQNHSVAIARARKVNRRIRAREQVLVFVRVANQRHARVVADPSLLHLHQLRDFRIRSVQLFQFFDVAGPHARLIERTIVGEQMLIASAYSQKSKNAEKKEFVAHTFILAAASGRAAPCAAGDTRRKDRCEPLCVGRARKIYPLA